MRDLMRTLKKAPAEENRTPIFDTGMKEKLIFARDEN